VPAAVHPANRQRTDHPRSENKTALFRATSKLAKNIVH
jgi:hypothetical protein